MGSIERLTALAATAIVWPEGEGVSITPGVCGGEPCFQHTRIMLGGVFASDGETDEEVDRRIRVDFPHVAALVACGRAYYERHADLFEAACWRSYMDESAFPDTDQDQGTRLQEDLRALLAARDRALERAARRDFALDGFPEDWAWRASAALREEYLTAARDWLYGE